MSNEIRENHVAWKYTNTQTNLEEIIYFPGSSRIASYIKDFNLTPNNLEKTKSLAFTETMDELANLEENDPANKTAIAIKEAKLALIFGLNLSTKNWKNFEFENKQYQNFLLLISTCTEEQLKIISPYLEEKILQENQYNTAVSIKLFFSHRFTTEQEKNEFKDLTKEIFNNPTTNDIQQKAAKLALMAAGLQQEKYYASLNQYPRLYEFLTDPAQCTEKIFKQRWFPDFLPALLDFPPQGKIDEVLRGKVGTTIEENKPAVLMHRNSNNPRPDYDYGILKYENAYLAVNYNDSLGEGAFGAVYKAYMLDSTGKVSVAQPYALKTTKNAIASLRNEPDNLTTLKNFEIEKEKNLRAGFGETLAPKQFKIVTLLNEETQEFFLPLEFVSGQNVGGKDPSDHFAELKNVFLTDANLAQRAKLAREFGMAVANLHKKGLLHGDLKGPNVRFSKRKLKNGKFAYDLTLIDFGLSKDMKNTAEDGSISFYQGSPQFCAPEVLLEEKAYNTTDTYSSAPFYKAIFGAENPLASKSNAPFDILPNVNYNNNGIMNDNICLQDEKYQHINSCITNFTDLCEEKDPKIRLSDEEIQIFHNSNCAFTEMAEMSESSLNDNGLGETDFDLHAAKCILISQGLWNKNIDDTLKFSDIDYEIYPEITHSIVEEYKKYKSDKIKNLKDLFASNIKKIRTKLIPVSMCNKILSGKELTSYDRKIIFEIIKQNFKDGVNINKLASADYPTRTIYLHSLIAAAEKHPMNQKYLDRYTALKETTNRSNISYNRFLLPAFIVAINFIAPSNLEDKITNKFSYNIINGIVEDATTPSSYWSRINEPDSEKRSNARKVIKNMPLDMIQKLINQMDPINDKDKINKITKLALGGKYFDPKFKPTGNFKTANEEIAEQKNQLNIFHWLFGTSTYKKHENAACLVNNNPCPLIIAERRETNNSKNIKSEVISTTNNLGRPDIQKDSEEDPMGEKAENLITTANTNTKNINNLQSQQTMTVSTAVYSKIEPIDLYEKTREVQDPEITGFRLKST